MPDTDALKPELLRYQIGITLIPGIGCVLAKQLIAYVGSVEGVFHESRKNLSKIPAIGEIRAKEIVNQNILARADTEVEFILKNRLSACFFTDPDYPFRLKDCPDAPLMLFGKGKLELNRGKFIGVVGTRKASDAGKEYCTHMITDLAAMCPDLTIVSGLAYGIDITAHKTALENGLPTIAIPGHGLDRIYPSRHRDTAVRMLENGGILTEFLSQTVPEGPNFVQRNRIIAGMSDATVVVESKKEGGSLITAMLASSYNRDVFAFPGRPTDENFAGCNRLIKSNRAALIENATDLIRNMNWDVEQRAPATNIQTSLFAELSEEESILLNCLRAQPDGIHVNELAIQTGKPYSTVSSILLNLEFKGMVKPLPGGMYRIIK